MQIILLRHAEVIEPFQGKYNGHIDIPLSEYGKNQAKALKSKFRDIEFDRVYCSDLLRTRETLEALDLEIKPIFTKSLREKSWGTHEGKSFEEIIESGLEYKNFNQWIEALDGESLEHFTSRVRYFFYERVFKGDGDNILIVTHSGVIKTLLSIYNNSSLEKAFAIKLPYCAYVEL